MCGHSWGKEERIPKPFDACTIPRVGYQGSASESVSAAFGRVSEYIVISSGQRTIPTGRETVDRYFEKSGTINMLS